MASYLDLDLSLTDDQKRLKEETHRFAREVVRPAAIKLDKISPDAVVAKDSPLWSVLRTAYELGHHSAPLPEAFGGMGLSGLERHIIKEELGWGSAGMAVCLGAATYPFFALTKSGNDELTRKFVVPFSEDKRAEFVGCWAITEADHGTDMMLGKTSANAPVLRTKTIARDDGDSWVINGAKAAWVSNGTIASHALVFLGVADKKGTFQGGGVAFVPLDLRGVSRGKPLDKIGMRALNQGEVFFEDVRIPKSYMLAHPENYAAVHEGTLMGSTTGMGCIFTGVARAAFEEALAYTRERVQGGSLLCEHPTIRRQLFEMFRCVETARAMSRAACNYALSGRPPQKHYGVAAKTHATRMALDVSHAAMQIFGGNGLTKEYVIEKLYRDARAGLICDGVNEALELGAGHLVLDRYEVS